jgi:ABC-2 type transport system ATP-binding protein
MNIIEIHHLTKYYGKSRGIEDVSFNVKENEIFGFIGPNGAGKSTTIRTLLGLIFPTSGHATIFGQDIVKEGNKLRRSIGYLPSEVFYYEKMKVIDLLKYSASFFEGDHTERMHELADIMELDLNRRIEDLSFGNKKKVGIVQGLLHKPKLIILDEPTSGLDPLMQQKFFKLIEKENNEGTTVLFSSHILSEVQHLCDRVAIIKEGSIVDVQDVKTLRENTYKKVQIKTESFNQAFIEQLEVVNLQQFNGQVSFVYKGDAQALLSVLRKIPLTDVLIQEPTLEEIFLHYYQ